MNELAEIISKNEDKIRARVDPGHVEGHAAGRFDEQGGIGRAMQGAA